MNPIYMFGEKMTWSLYSEKMHFFLLFFFPLLLYYHSFFVSCFNELLSKNLMGGRTQPEYFLTSYSA